MHRLLVPTTEEKFAALERFIQKVREPVNSQPLDDTESEWLSVLKRVHSRYCRRIRWRDSCDLSCGALCICLDEDDAEIEKACVKAHSEALRPPRKKRKHVSIDDDDVPELVSREEGVHEAVMEALSQLKEDDEILLREVYMGHGKRSIKELAQKHGVDPDAMRQRLARARRRLKLIYERANRDDDR